MIKSMLARLEICHSLAPI
jgi:hypothetical protein